MSLPDMSEGRSLSAGPDVVNDDARDSVVALSSLMARLFVVRGHTVMHSRHLFGLAESPLNYQERGSR